MKKDAALLGIGVSAVFLVFAGGISLIHADDEKQIPAIEGRIVAAGIPGISAISQVGTFLPGGPIHDKAAFAAFTQPGRVLDPARLLVGSNSNFGEPLADPGQSP